jgi:hypothetical protein
MAAGKIHGLALALALALGQGCATRSVVVVDFAPGGLP